MTPPGPAGNPLASDVRRRTFPRLVGIWMSADVGQTRQSSSRHGLYSFPSSFLFLVSFLTTLDAHMTLMTFYFIPFHILPFILTHGKPCVILVASRLSDVPTFPRFVGIFVQLPPSYISR